VNFGILGSLEFILVDLEDCIISMQKKRIRSLIAIDNYKYGIIYTAALDIGCGGKERLEREVEEGV